MLEIDMRSNNWFQFDIRAARHDHIFGRLDALRFVAANAHNLIAANIDTNPQLALSIVKHEEGWNAHYAGGR